MHRFSRAWTAIGMPDQLTFIIDPTDEFSSLDLLVKSMEDIKRLLRDVDYAIYGPWQQVPTGMDGHQHQVERPNDNPDA